MKTKGWRGDVDKQLTNITMGGLPTRAIAVLSFRLFPPLINIKKRSHPLITPPYNPASPVGARALAGMLRKIQPANLRVHDLLDLLLRNSTQSSKHGQQLPTSQPFNQCIKLQNQNEGEMEEPRTALGDDENAQLR